MKWGFTGIDHLASGDDMLLLHKISARYPERVHYVKSPSVIIETRAEKTTGDFLISAYVRPASRAITRIKGCCLYYCLYIYSTSSF